jgi:hypothetical protein
MCLAFSIVTVAFNINPSFFYVHESERQRLQREHGIEKENVPNKLDLQNIGFATEILDLEQY